MVNNKNKSQLAWKNKKKKPNKKSNHNQSPSNQQTKPSSQHMKPPKQKKPNSKQASLGISVNQFPQLISKQAIEDLSGCPDEHLNHQALISKE